MGMRNLLYRLYERRLEAKLATVQIPRHVGVIVDGNRRWARSMGLRDVSRDDLARLGSALGFVAAACVALAFYRGHQKGADKISELLEWCREMGVEVVTVWLLSSDNINRAKDELDALIEIIEVTVQDLVAGGWHVNPMGSLDLLPDHMARVLKDAKERTSHRPGLIVNVAVGYGGRREIADAVRSLLQEHASTGASIEELVEVLDVEHIAEHLYTRGQPDPDLLIRTSGEQRLSGFMLWQSAHSEFYFCEAYWPDFRRVDFLRALRSYAARHRRYGS